MIIIRDRIYIRASEISKELLLNYEKCIYEEYTCAKCEYLADRHSYLCDTCPAFTKRIVLYTKKEIKNVVYYGFPIGSKRLLPRLLDINYSEHKILDKRSVVPFNYNIKLTVSLREEQIRLKEEFRKKDYGLMVAPPRTGKTLLALATALELGQRTLFLAEQQEFLTQFLDHIHGNEPEGIPKCTNLPEIEQKVGKKLYGVPTKPEHYQQYQIMCMTWQSFITELGKKRLSLVNKNIGTLAVDEVHSSGSNHFSRVIQSVAARYKFGVTGTIERKDGLEWVVYHTVGPVVAESTIETLAPTVFVVPTSLKEKVYTNARSSWVYCMQYIAKDKKRNKQIIDQAICDIKSGHSIIIPVLFKKHVITLVDEINKAYGKHVAEAFIGGTAAKNKRKQVLVDAKSGKIKVVVGIRKLLQLGLNVPAWSAIYLVMPISNKPKLKQETKRVCTPLPGKKAIVRLFVDLNQKQSKGCALKTVGHMRSFGYKMSKDTTTVDTVKQLRKKKREAAPWEI